LDERRFVGGDAENEPLPVAQQLRLDREFEERVEQARAEYAAQRAARAVKTSAQREAIGNALASMKLQLCVVKAVATVPELVGAAVLARRDALSALGAAPADQQLAVLDAVAAVFEKEGVSLAELGRSLPLAEQLVIHAEWVQRIEARVEQREAIGNALASMNLQLCVVKGVAKVPELVGAAVRARRDALLALGDASPDQQLVALDSVAAVFEREGVSLAELGRSRPLAEQLAIHAEWVQRIRKRNRTPEQQAPRRRPNQSRATNPSHAGHGA
jgi:hypothetical protein